MNLEDAVLAVLAGLNRLAVPYMLVGSFSSNTYGIPRATQDADFVVQVEAEGVRRIVEQLGPPFRLEPQVTFETITATTRYAVEVTGTAFTIEFFLLSDDPHDKQRFVRRQEVELPGHRAAATMPTAEDVVITKLRWFKSARRAKDFDDVRGIIAVRGDRLDWNYLHHWSDLHGTRELLEQALASIPPV